MQWVAGLGRAVLVALRRVVRTGSEEDLGTSGNASGTEDQETRSAPQRALRFSA